MSIPSQDPGSLAREGLNHHLAGKTTQAEAMYRQALGMDPNQADALHLLGVLLAQRGQHEVALPLLQRAVALIGHIGEFHRHLADVYALMNRNAEAFNSYLTAVQLDGRDINAGYGAARSAANLGRNDQAIDLLQRITAVQPDNISAWSDLGIVLTRIGQYERSTEALRRALAVNPDFPHALTALSDALRQSGKVDEALEPARRGALLQPTDAWAQVALGNVLQVLGQFEESAEQYRRALTIDANNFDAINNLGLVLLKMGRANEALDLLEKTVQRWPDSADVRANRSLALLTLGDWDRGWPEYETRFQSLAFKSIPLPAQPRWDGSPQPGTTILLNSEQGLGDTIHFARYIPLIAERGLRVILACPPEIQDLMRTVPGVGQVVPRNSAPPPFELWAPMASLPFIFRTTHDTVPKNIPYIHAEVPRVQAWHQRLAQRAADALKVGIVWAGSPSHQNDRARSCRLEHFVPLAQIAGVKLFSLQKGSAAAALASAPAITPLGDELKDFTETAALLEALDLLISVDTSVIHVAGALGKPVWTVLAHGPDWRWMLHRPDTPWYPTMRLFRQPRLHDWNSVFEQVAGQLAEMAQRRQV